MERDPANIAQALASRSELQAVIRESVDFARQHGGDQCRVIAEEIVSRLYNSFNGFTTTH